MKRRASSRSSCMGSLLIGAFFLILLVIFVGQSFSLALFGRSTQGVIAGRSACNAGAEGNVDPGWVLQIAYTDGAGRAHTFLTDCRHPRIATPGSPVAVRYLSTDPGIVDLEDNLTFAPWLPFIVLAFLCIMALAALLGARGEIADFFALRKLEKLQRARTKRSPQS